MKIFVKNKNKVVYSFAKKIKRILDTKKQLLSKSSKQYYVANNFVIK